MGSEPDISDAEMSDLESDSNSDRASDIVSDDDDGLFWSDDEPESDDSSEVADSNEDSESDSSGSNGDGGGGGPWIHVSELDRDDVPTTHRFRARDANRVLADVDQNSSPLDFVRLFPTTRFLETLIDFTKKYAKKTIDAVKAKHRARGRNDIPPRSRYRQWGKLSAQLGLPLILAFFGLFLNMGLVKKAVIEDYWNVTDWSQSTPAFPQVMSRDRFLLILCMLQFYDVEDERDMDDPSRKLKL